MASGGEGRVDPSLAFCMSLAVWGQALDGVTRAVMPDRNELNPVSVVLGGPGSLLAKVALVGFVIWVALEFRSAWWARPLLLFAGLVGVIGMATNVAVLV